MSTLCLTKILYAFTSQVEDNCILMEEISSHAEPLGNSSLDPAEPIIWQGGVALSFVLECRVRAVADREARPGLK
jgi:hypothetical protein